MNSGHLSIAMIFALVIVIVVAALMLGSIRSKENQIANKRESWTIQFGIDDQSLRWTWMMDGGEAIPFTRARVWLKNEYGHIHRILESKREGYGTFSIPADDLLVDLDYFVADQLHKKHELVWEVMGQNGEEAVYSVPFELAKIHPDKVTYLFEDHDQSFFLASTRGGSEFIRRMINREYS